MVDHDQFFELNDSQKPVDKPRKEKSGGRRSINSAIIVKEEADVWRLFTVAFGREQPAGGRLLKHEPWPVDRFTFSTKQEANDAAEALAKYLGTKFIDDSKHN
jgi:hypothetical protein